MFRLKSSLAILFSLMLAACGGGGDVVSGSGDSTGGSTGGSTGTGGTSAVTYFPLQVFQQGTNYVPMDAFEGVLFDPLIHGYVIAPVNAITLAPVANPRVSDFRFTIDGADVDPDENGLMMQPILGLPTYLNTAIIIDTSGSSQALDKAALIQEVKRYIAEAKSSPDPAISTQKFTLWAYGTGVDALVGTLTDDTVTLEAALDNLLINWDNRGEGSSTYAALFAAIGSFANNATLESGATVLTDTFSDLKDGYVYNAAFGSGRSRLDGVNLSSVVLFASGPNTNNDFQLADAKAAVEWQSFIVYTEEADAEGAEESNDSVLQEGTKLIPKPVIYVSLGTKGPDSNIAGLSSYVINTNSTANFAAVAEKIIEAQKSALELRTRPDNQYLVRYSLFERYGDHELIFASATNGFNYTLTTALEGLSGGADVLPVVEITGPGNAYLAADQVSLSDTRVLYPATRWTSIPYSSADYSWSGGGTVNADGSLTINSPGTITLTNTVLLISTSVTVTN